MDFEQAPGASRRSARPAWAVAGLVALAWAALVEPAASQPVVVERATDILRRWEPSQHLYVKGDVGVGAAQLAELEAWLRTNATNWTVALLDHAREERFTDSAGESFAGMDAVEHALGKGLPNQTAFGSFTDARTSERNGAFFVLFLDERKFSYFGSEAQDRRGLGEDRWVGQLDRPAVAAMRSGGRILDAVKDTITSIEGQLAQRIAAERLEGERREAEARARRERDLAQAKASLETATAALRDIESRLGVFKAEFPRLTGELTHPPLFEWQADLETAASVLAGGNPSGARKLADGVQERAKGAMRALEDYRLAGPELDVLGRRLEQAGGEPYASSAKDELGAGLQALAEARQVHERGDAGYPDRLDAARRGVNAAEAAIGEAARAAQMRRRVVTAGAGAGGFSVLALGILLNRLRRGRRREALELVEAWTKALDEKTLALFNLLDRTYVVVGSSAEEARHRFAGTTLASSQQIIRDVDELTIMSSCASRILTDAKALALPKAMPPRVVNLFLGARFDAAIRRLRDEPITFRPEEGLELVMRGVKTERDRLLGSLDSYQPFQFSFNELIAAFNQRAERALSGLTQVESALASVGGKLEGAEERIKAVKGLEARIRAVDGDAVFRVAPVFNELLPAAARTLSEAAQVSIRDAVGALGNQAVRAERQAEDALALAQLAVEFRQTHGPRLRGAEEQLLSAGLQTAWLPAAVADLSDRADQVALGAVEVSAAEAIAELRADVSALAERVGQIVRLDRARRETGQRSISDAQAAVAAARADLARELGKMPGEMLRELDLDPSEHIGRAEDQLAAARAALERGAVADAQDGLAEVARLTEDAMELVEATRQAFVAHDGELAARRAETGRLEDQLPGHEAVLVDLAAGYAPSVFMLGQGDPTHPNANGTARDNLDEARAHLAACRELTEQSVVAFSEAQILKSADLLRQAAARQEQTVFRLQEIREKEQRIRGTETANDAQVEQLTQRVQGVEAGVRDVRTMRPTVAAFESARQQLDEAVRLRSVTPRDPFAVSAALTAVEEVLDQVADQARCDQESHAAARRSLEAAAAELEVARRLRGEAARDPVPDSPAIVEAGSALEALSGSLAGLDARLGEAHGDWLALDAEANGVAQEAGRLAATLRGELEAAERAIAALNAAAARVRAAGAWAGGLGVLIRGAPGSPDLEQARRILETGNYREARHLAEAARRAAELAIAQAEAERQRRRQAEEERRAHERRARQAAEWARRSTFGSGGLGGASRGRSGFLIGSGASRSTFQSGSGVGRSGW